MKNHNVGIIGYGWAAEAHLPAINATSLAQVTAMRSEELRRAVNMQEVTGSPGDPG